MSSTNFSQQTVPSLVLLSYRYYLILFDLQQSNKITVYRRKKYKALDYILPEKSAELKHHGNIIEDRTRK